MSLPEWCSLVEFLRLGKLTNNAFMESFNGHLREEFLDHHWFESLAEPGR
jgi:putative transposase